jgi:small conductance mechanosensitive channel
MNIEMETIEKLLDAALQFIVQYSFQILGALIILVIGIYAARWLSKSVVRVCERKNLDVTLGKFLGNVVKSSCSSSSSSLPWDSSVFP